MMVRRGRRLARHVAVRGRATILRIGRALAVVPPIKVSIVVATYNTDPARLTALLASVAAQTMPARHIEIVFVDDGSTDDTLERLRRHARRRANVVVRSIPNSGWAGRPRNVGLRLAHGEYVLFMDHDDVLFPRGLERAYAYGRAHDADVVNGKEVRTAGWSWGWDAFRSDVPTAQRIDPNPLIPMTPHKLYRRRFLREHGLQFREGRRVFWEDIYFNLAAFTRGARVAVLASRPVYHWVATGENNSSSYSRPDREFWVNLAELLAYHDTELRGIAGGPEQVDHQIRARVLTFVGPRLLRLDAEDAAEVFDSARALVMRYAPPGRDDALASVHRCQIELLRRGDLARQRRLAQCDDGVNAVPVVDDVRWEGSELVVSASSPLMDGAGDPVTLRRTAAGWLRELPDDVAAELSPAARDVTRDLERASFVLSVKGRTTRSTWELPGASEVICTDDGSGLGVLRARAVVRFDPVAFAAAHDLQDDAVFDFGARLEALGFVLHRALRGGEPRAALLDGVAALAYVNSSGGFSLDVRAARSLTRVTAPDPATARVSRRAAAEVSVQLELPGVHCVGATSHAGQVLLPDDVALSATLAGADGRAVLSFAGTVAPGEHALRTRFDGRTAPTGLARSVTGGAAHVVAAP